MKIRDITEKISVKKLTYNAMFHGKLVDKTGELKYA